MNKTNISDYSDTSFRDHIDMVLSKPEESIGLLVGIAGVVANIWALCAVLHVRSGLTLHYKLIASLAVSDMLISFTSVLAIIQKIVIPVGHPDMGHHPLCLHMFLRALNNTSLNISLLNLMAMALDHYLAILRPLHYPTMFNSLRANILIICLWVLAMILGFSNFMTGHQYTSKKTNQTETAVPMSYCERVDGSKYQEEYTVFVNAMICFIIMMAVYGRIYWETQKHMKRTPGIFQEMQKNKKALVTTLLILGTFIICWFPNCLFQVALIIQIQIDKQGVTAMVKVLTILDPFFFILLLLNSLLDPVIYAVRIREIRFGYRKLCYHCCKCCMERPRRNDPNADYTTHCTMLLEERKNSHCSFKDDYNNIIVNNKHH